MNRSNKPRRSMRRHFFFLFGVIALSSSFGCASDRAPSEQTNNVSATARAHLDQIIGIMQNNSIKRRTINWTSFRDSVLHEAANAQTIADTYTAIRVALAILGDGHSVYQSKTGVVINVPTRGCSYTGIGVVAVPNTIGYVKVGSFGGSAAQATAFADGIQTTIKNADRADLIGWVVDLRGNGGGNMWPMVAGLGPIIGEGTLGYFIDPFGVESQWEYRDGASWLSGSAVQRVTAPYKLLKERPRVAVLTDKGVASSGEATAIAFRQRPEARTFGTATCGLSTANRSFPLNDGALLILTTSVMADRLRVAYGDSIPPDETLSNRTQALLRAIAWLETGK